VTLPIAFGNMPGGYVVGLMFFVLLFFAAFSTVIGMLEPVVSWLEEHASMTRSRVAVGAGVFGWAAGIAAALSFNVWSDIRPLAFLQLTRDKSIFDALDFLVSNLLLPINGLLIALFAGWVLPGVALRDELEMGEGRLYGYVIFILRYVAPLIIGIIFFTSLA
jgi:NSS family neurotransmitter:Na+ symporter